MAVVEDGLDGAGWKRREQYCRELGLVPDLFPLLNHARLKDMVSGTSEDPIEASLRSITRDRTPKPL